MDRLNPSAFAISPEVDNQAPPLVGYNAWTGDTLLQEAVRREGAGWIAAEAASLGALVGSERLQRLADQANRNAPELQTHDRYGNRVDAVDYHPAYHELMSLAFGAGLHSIAWTAGRKGAFVARAALNYLWNQGENGVGCPVAMSFAAAHVLDNEPRLAAEWKPKLLSRDYDPRPLHVSHKRAVTIGMAMTEKQGGSDLRSNTTRAVSAGGGGYELTGHKWFCSAPMSDGFFTLARLDDSMTCFFVARSLPDGSRNPFHIQRLKDKLGNRSNASSEIEYAGTRAHIVGKPGRGIATIIEMAHMTRFDIVIANAGMMRAALNQALHHCAHRQAFGRLLAGQTLMQNVLADLALECEAATLLAFRLARAWDEAPGNAHERQLMRIMTPLAKYWSCKRLPALVLEAMECLGGNGYVEELPLARLYREAPVNGIWEGSGNVICLDVLRTIERSPECVDALLVEIRRGGKPLEPAATMLERALRDPSGFEPRARRVVEQAALALQASLMLQHAKAPAADAFCASRIEGDWGRVCGTLPAGTDCGAILARAALAA
jgi:putative acyl-CoA dehydrogenase